MRTSGSPIPFTGPVAVHSVFESNARNYPNRLAVTCGDDSLTYRKLNERANHLAHYLLSKGIGGGSLVGVCLDRSPELVVAILAILKAGAAYVPLDTTYPAQRLRTMAAQLTQMQLVLCSGETAAMLGTTTAELLDLKAAEPGLASLPAADPAAEISGDALCYVVFTSGSTGTPKATGVRHRGWYNLLSWLVREFGLDWRSDNLMLSSLGFDISQRSLMTALFTGATQHLLPSRNFDPMMAGRLIGELGVRTLHCAPSTLYLLVEGDADRDGRASSSLDYVFVGGEPLNAGRVGDWASKPGNRCRLVNVYGVAECTDVSIAHVLHDYPRYQRTGVPIGLPVSNTDIYLLDDAMCPVQAGETGEICVAGVGVGAGYLNAPALTAERFVRIDIDGEEVGLYRTGDLGYLAADGVLMCVGRVDAQVKIRGMRIDLGDVETAIRATGLVSDATVVAVKDTGGEEHLVAFVIVPGGAFDEPAMRARLRADLPASMLPNRYMPTDGFPLNPNGKVDRTALSASATRS